MDYATTLKEIFPNRSIEQINDIIEMVLENGAEDNNIEIMISFLAESGDSTLCNPEGTLDEAAGYDDQG